ncbi:MAG: hypothetical protein Q4C14_03165, partial [Bacillota bacterium]|nr:hypothetical protein [Bacillota bacterium]
MRNRGSVMIESAVVIPVIIILFASLITLMMGFYDMVISETGKDCEKFHEGYYESDSLRRAAVTGDLIEKE